MQELRTMPYQEYQKTPEWLARQKSILGGQACIACGTSNHLSVYHFSHALDRLGAEQDEDLTVLCTECYEEMQKTAQAIASPQLPFWQKTGIFLLTGSALLAFLIVLHAPTPTLIGALVGAWSLARYSPAILAWLHQVHNWKGTKE
jgi:hypothetical protein